MPARLFDQHGCAGVARCLLPATRSRRSPLNQAA